MMHRLLLPVLLCLAASPGIGNAGDHPSPPVTQDTHSIATETLASPEQVERLLDVIQARKIVDSILPMMQQRMETSFMSAVGDRLSAKEQQEALRMFERQMVSLRELLAWEQLKPIYIRSYTQTFTSAEVEGMIDFYSSPVGRSAIAKTPQVMEASMREMQPLLEKTLHRLMDDLQRDIQRLPTTSDRKH